MFQDVYVNSFFPGTARLWSYLPIECFPWNYDLNGFKSRINRHLSEFFPNRFPVRFNLFALLFLITLCLVVAVSALYKVIPLLNKSSHFLNKPARGVSEIRDGGDLWQWSRLKIRLNAFRRSTIPQKQFIIKKQFKPIGPKFGPPIYLFIFFRNLALLVTRYHGQLSCTIPEKTYDPILRKFCDGWSDKRTEKDRLARVIS